jgi:5-methylcytosine-specific restriction endonuclease McrA
MGRLKAIGTRLTAAKQTSVAFVKKAEAYYGTSEWQALRMSCLKRDGFSCQVCGDKATIADHIISRRNGGSDTLTNLRAMCRTCDNKAKEDHMGVRRGQTTPR